MGTEHVIELNPIRNGVGKTTQPSGFGLVAELIKVPVVKNPRDSDKQTFREAIEFVPGTPLEYLSRWMAANQLFGDDVRLASVIQWSDGLVSMGITQPFYPGVPADLRDIEQYFMNEGWERLNDPSGHTVFFNYAFGMMAIDAVSRNCYLAEYGLQPFDVILREPDQDLERFLQIYPS